MFLKATVPVGLQLQFQMAIFWDNGLQIPIFHEIQKVIEQLFKGIGEVILNEQTIPVQAGSYVKIPVGAKHRIRNTGNQALEFVEVQLGSYFGEDDIVRYQDDYKRS